jgi:hypothetical protein
MEDGENSDPLAAAFVEYGVREPANECATVLTIDRRRLFRVSADLLESALQATKKLLAKTYALILIPTVSLI